MIAPDRATQLHLQVTVCINRMTEVAAELDRADEPACATHIRAAMYSLAKASAALYGRAGEADKATVTSVLGHPTSRVETRFRVESLDGEVWRPCMSRDWPSKEAAMNAIDSLQHCHPRETGRYRVVDQDTSSVVGTRTVR